MENIFHFVVITDNHTYSIYKDHQEIWLNLVDASINYFFIDGTTAPPLKNLGGFLRYQNNTMTVIF